MGKGMSWPAEEDFWLGVNLPWMHYGGDFGANRWRPGGGVGQSDRRAVLRAALGRLAGQGVTVIRWFMLADGRAGLRESPSGELIGLDDFVLRDADAAIEELDRAGLRAIFVLFDFHVFKPLRIIDGVAAGGRGLFAADPALRSRLLQQVITPLLDRYGRHASIAAWDVLNEPEWVTRSARPPFRRSSVPREAMRAFIRETVSLIHDRTSHAATVGSASTRTLSLVEGLGLDVYQAHWYDRLAKQAPLDRPVAELRLDRPLILGEFPTRGSRRSPADIVEIARQAGYAGALAWSALADDDASDASALAAGLSAFTADTALNRARP